MAPYAPLPLLSERRPTGLHLSQLGVSIPDLRALPRYVRRTDRRESDSRPRSTNMRRAIDLLPIPAGRRRVQTPTDDEDEGTGDVSRRTRPAVPAVPTPLPTMLMAMPCLRVSHLPLSLSFYTRVLRFRRFGPRDPTQARLFRGAPGTVPSLNGGAPGMRPSMPPGVYVLLRPWPGGASSQRGELQTLWLMVTDVEACFRDAAALLLHTATVQEGYFPEYDFAEAKILTRPQLLPDGSREFRVRDPDGHTLVLSDMGR